MAVWTRWVLLLLSSLPCLEGTGHISLEDMVSSHILSSTLASAASLYQVP
jgi:hypothetical protein